MTETDSVLRASLKPIEREQGALLLPLESRFLRKMQLKRGSPGLERLSKSAKRSQFRGQPGLVIL